MVRCWWAESLRLRCAAFFLCGAALWLRVAPLLLALDAVVVEFFRGHDLYLRISLFVVLISFCAIINRVASDLRPKDSDGKGFQRILQR